MVFEDGEQWDIAPENVAKAERQGARLLTEQEQAEARVEPKLGEAGSVAAAAGIGALGGATFGVGTQILAGLSAGFQGIRRDQAQDQLRDIQTASPVAATVGEIGGAIGSAFVLPGGGLAGSAERLILNQAAKAAPKLATKIAASAAGGAAEGAAYGVGSLIHENALGAADFTAEAILAAGGAGALFGGGLTGAGTAAMAGAKRAAKVVAPEGAAQFLREMSEQMTGHAMGIRGSDYPKLAGGGGRGKEEALSLLGRGRDMVDPATGERLIETGDNLEKIARKSTSARDFIGKDVQNAATGLDAAMFSRVSPQAAAKHPEIPSYFFIKDPEVSPAWLDDFFGKHIDSMRRDPRYRNIDGEVSPYAKDVETVAESLKPIAEWYSLGEWAVQKEQLKVQINKLNQRSQLAYQYKDFAAAEEWGSETMAARASLKALEEKIARVSSMNFNGGFEDVWKYRKALDGILYGLDPTKLSTFTPTEKKLLQQALRNTIQGHLKQAAGKIDPAKGAAFIEASAKYHDIARLDNLVQLRNMHEKGLSPISLSGKMFAAAGLAGGIASGSPVAPLMALAGAAGTHLVKEFGGAALARLTDKASKFAAARQAQDYVSGKVSQGIRRFLSGARAVGARTAGSWSIDSRLDPDEARERGQDYEGMIGRAQTAFADVSDEMPGVGMLGVQKAMSLQQAVAARAPQGQAGSILPGVRKQLPPKDRKDWDDFSTAAAHPAEVIAQDLPNLTLTPTKVEALATLWPALYDEARKALLLQVQQHATPLSPEHIAQLEMFTGVPLQPSSTPEYQAFLQAFERARAGKDQERVENAGIRKSAVDASRISSNNRTRGTTPAAALLSRGGKLA